jgi:CubicO group peptidase (beta-lactamase class C family)
MVRLLAALLLLAFVPPLHADDFDTKPIDAVVEKAMKEFKAPGVAVVVVKDDQIVHLKGYGVRKQGEEEPVTPDTVFAIASCSKAFTATLAAMLVDEGKLAWDDKVRDRLEAFRLADELADREVTFRDLLSHRTGMPRHDMLWAGRDSGTENLIRAWMRAKPSTSFRSTWEYSNVPFTTAAYVSGKLSGSDWATAAKNRIFDPLGMTSTSARAKDRAKERATPHYRGIDQSITAVEWDTIDHAGGAGNIASTARDMGQWLRFQLAGGKRDGKRLLAEKHLKETHTPQMIVRPEGPFATYFPPKAGKFVNYGLGWFVHDYRGHVCVSHGGTLTGFRAQVMMVPEQKLGVCVLCNLRPSFVAEAVTKSVIDHALGLPAEDWVKFHTAAYAMFDFQTTVNRKAREASRKKDTKPSLPPAKYAGRYGEPAYGVAEIEDRDGVLHLTWGKFTFRLDHHHFDTFTAVPISPKADVIAFDRSTFECLFRLGTDGEVSGMKFFDQEFTRRNEKK